MGWEEVDVVEKGSWDREDRKWKGITERKFNINGFNCKWMSEMMMMLPTWRLELEVERLMIAEPAPSASCRKHARRDNTTHTC